MIVRLFWSKIVLHVCLQYVQYVLVNAYIFTIGFTSSFEKGENVILHKDGKIINGIRSLPYNLTILLLRQVSSVARETSCIYLHYF